MELFFCLGGIAPEIYNVGRSVEIFGYLYKNLSCCLVIALLIYAFALKFKFDSCIVECKLSKFTNRMLLRKANGNEIRI